MQRLAVSDNRRFLVTGDGRPFFYLGDTAWELGYRLTRDDVRLYLKDRAEKGFTVVHMMGLPEIGKLERPNAQGNLPLIDKDPARPNPAFFDDMEYILDEAQANGLFVGLLPCWGDHVGPPLHCGTNPQILNPGNAKAYGAFWGRRFANKQLVWILGGDRPIETSEQLATWRALAEGVREGDGGTHLMTFHPIRDSVSSSTNFQEDDWLDFNLIQTGHGQRDEVTYEKVQTDYEKRPVKPTMESEYCYESHPENWKANGRRYDDYDQRKGAYWSLFAGGFGFTYGCNDIFSFYRGQEDLALFGPFHPYLPWRHALDLPGTRQMRHVRALFESRPFLTRIPDQSLLLSDPGEGSEHVRATRDESGSYAFVYCVMGKPVTIDLAKLSGSTLTAWWYDPRVGAAFKIDELSREGKKEFTPPTSGYGHDWILVLDETAQGFPAPGRAK